MTKILIDRESVEQALEALDSDNPDIQLRAAITLRAALAESDDEQAKYDPFAPILYAGNGNPEINRQNKNTMTVLPPIGCLTTNKAVLPRWVAVFEEEIKKPLAVIGLKRDDIKQAARDYRLMQDLYEGVSTIRDAAVRFLAEAQGQKSSKLFDPLNLYTLSSCIDHHAAELFRLRAKVQNLEALLEQKQ